jgi:hypothetical protein
MKLSTLASTVCTPSHTANTLLVAGGEEDERKKKDSGRAHTGSGAASYL